ncbi:acyl-CoA dehydrogenase [Lysinibacillus yapensis]|uniref:Acyl-CoA dehydrogenase n=1 Tax=Ureibacillus yapensis TaxID=2304605 RepID=A0A396SBD8_9BACL|nr:acyl-CoA dehydrogenase family protein [Lysinibacillus yapensis]RHW38442.1 acyl-CoA dehydrogenase [Lysinibacillus yapensis]
MNSSTKKSYTSFLYKNSNPADVFTVEEFSDEHIMLQKTTQKFVEGEIIPVLKNIEEKEFDHTKKIMAKAGGIGLIGADIAEEDGGLELGKVSAAIIAEEMARARSFSITFGGQTGIGALPIAYFGSKDQKERYLPKLLSGENIAAYALTEPSAGTDALGIKTTATLSACGQFYILNGEKQWITNSAFADVFIVYAKVDSRHFTAFIVDADSKGLSTGPEEKKMGLDGSSTRSVILENVLVPVDNLIGEIGRGHIIAFNVLNFGRHKIALSSLGSAKRAMQLAIEYGNTRQQFNKPLTQFNLIREKIADMAVQAAAVESVLYRTAGELEESFQESKENLAKSIAKFALHCSINKVMATEAVGHIVDEALQIHGGYGYMREYEIETIYRDIRINRIFEGTNEINRILIAGTVMKEFEAETEENLPSGPFEEEVQKLTLSRKVLREYIETARSMGLSDMNKEQELAAVIADTVIAVYAMDSILARAQKLEGKNKNKTAQIAAKIYIQETAQRLGLNALNYGVYLKNQEQLAKLANQLILDHSNNVVDLKRQIAELVINS